MAIVLSPSASSGAQVQTEGAAAAIAQNPNALTLGSPALETQIQQQPTGQTPATTVRTPGAPLSVAGQQQVISAGNAVKLSTGEYVSKVDFDKLSPADQALLMQLGIEKFNQQKQTDLQNFNANNVKLSTGEYISKDAFSKLSPADQQLLMNLGIAKFNEQKQAAYQSFASQNTQLPNGEWIPNQFYNDLTPAALAVLRGSGTTAFNQWLVGKTPSDVFKDGAWKPDFTQPNPYAGMPFWYQAWESANFIPTVSNPNPPSSAYTGGTSSAPSSGSVSGVSALPGQGEVSSFQPDFTKSNPYEGAPLSYYQLEISGYIPTSANPLPPSLTYLQANPTAQLVAPTQVAAAQPFTQSEFTVYQMATPQQKFNMLMDKGYIPKGSQYAGVDASGQVQFLTPENALRTKIVELWNQRVGQLTQLQSEAQQIRENAKQSLGNFVDSSSALNLGGAVAAGIPLTTIRNAGYNVTQDQYDSVGKQLTAQKALDAYKTTLQGPFQTETGIVAGKVSYDIPKFLDDNKYSDESIKTLQTLGVPQKAIDALVTLHGRPVADVLGKNPTSDTVGLLRDAGYPKELVDAAQKYSDDANRAMQSLSSLIATDKMGTGKHPDVDGLQRALSASGLKGFTEVAGMPLSTPDSVRTLWNGLTNEQKLEVSGHFAADPFSDKGFASSIYNINQFVAKNPYTVGLIASMPLAAITPVVHSTSDIPVTKQEWAVGGASAVLTVLGVGGAGALASLGTVGKITEVTLLTGSGVIFTKQTIDDFPNLVKAPNQLAIAVGMDALIFLGAGLSIKGIGANEAARSAASTVSKATQPTGIELDIPTRIGESISSVKTFISEIPNRVMTAPDAIKYYTEGLGLKAEQVADVIKRGLLETTPEIAQRVAVEIKFAGEDIAKRIMTAPEAIKYYSEGLGIEASKIADLAKRGLLEVTPDIARQIGDSIKSGVDVIGRRVMTAPQAIAYYTHGLGLDVAKVAELAKHGLLEVTPEVASRIAQNIKNFGGDIVTRVMTTPEAIAYYSKELGLKAEHIAELAKKGLLEVTPQTATKIANQIKQAASSAVKTVITAPDAIAYYTKELELKASDIVELAKKKLPDVTTEQARKVVESVKANVWKFATAPEAIEYYIGELGIKAERLEGAIGKAIESNLNEIYDAMKAKDRASVIQKAQRLEQLSGEIEDVDIAKLLKERAKDLQAHVDDYLKLSDNIPTSDAEVVSDGLKATDGVVKQTYQKLLSETRPVTERDIAEIAPDVVEPHMLEAGMREYTGSDLGELKGGTTEPEAIRLQRENRARLEQQLKAGTVQDVDTYLKTQQAKSVNIPKLEKQGASLTTQDIETYLESLRERAKTLKGLDAQVVNETVKDLEEYVRNRKALEGFKTVIPEEGTIPVKPVNMEELNLLVEISKDNLLLTDLRNQGADPLDIQRVISRISENSQKLAKLREAIKDESLGKSLDLSEALDVRLKQLGYSETDIANMSDADKLTIVEKGTPPTGLPDIFKEALPEPPPEKGGGGVAVKEKTEVKPETKTETVVKEKTAVEEKPKTETKTEEKTKTEAKPETKTETKTGTTTDTERQVFAPPAPVEAGDIYTLVWEGGRLHWAWVHVDPLQQGYVKVQTQTKEAVIPQEEFNRMTPEQVRRLYVQVEESKEEKPLVIPYMVPQPSPQPSPRPEPQPTPQPFPQPIPTPMPEPRPEPRPEPQPFPQPEPAPQPSPQPGPKPEIPIPILVKQETKAPPPPITLPEMPEEWKKNGIPESTWEWRQGKKWVVLPPPYRDEDKMYLDKPLPGTYKFATGRGSAYKTLQIINPAMGRANEADINMGWAKVHVKQTGRDLVLTFAGGEDAANERWAMEEAAMQEFERQAYANRPQVAISERIPRMKTQIPVQPFSLNKTEIPEYSTDGLQVYSVNPAYIRSRYANQMIGDRKGVDWVSGGHEFVYWNLVPKGEIWVDNTLEPEDRDAVIAHEIEERAKMSKGMEYSEAHNDYANEVEIKARENPLEAKQMIAEMIEKYHKEHPEPNRRQRPRSTPQTVNTNGIRERFYLGRKLPASSVGGV